MYQEHFGLQAAPFSLTPNTGLYYGLPPHEEAMQVLRIALAGGEGFIKVTGEVGTGKTLLLRKMMAELAASHQVIYLPNPYLAADELRMALAHELGLTPEHGDLAVTDAIHRRLVELHRDGRSAVLLLDEAQALPDASLEAIRLFGNLETESSKLLQVVLFGQPELDGHLRSDDLRQLRQRITFSYRLRPLLRDETRAYLEYRLSASGYRGVPVFSAAAVRRLWRASRGIPRLINILAHKSLMLAYGQGERRVGTALVNAAIKDTEDASTTIPLHWWLLWAALAGISLWLLRGAL